MRKKVRNIKNSPQKLRFYFLRKKITNRENTTNRFTKRSIKNRVPDRENSIPTSQKGKQVHEYKTVMIQSRTDIDVQELKFKLRERETQPVKLYHKILSDLKKQ